VTIFLALNDRTLTATVDDAVALMLVVVAAAGDFDEVAVEAWVRRRIDSTP